MTRYTSVTEDDRREMLEAIGVSSVEELFADIPTQLRLDRPLAVVVLRSDCMAFGIEPRIDAVMEAEPSCTPGRNTFCAPGTRTPFGLAGYPVGAICGARNT